MTCREHTVTLARSHANAYMAAVCQINVARPASTRARVFPSFATLGRRRWLSDAQARVGCHDLICGRETWEMLFRERRWVRAPCGPRPGRAGCWMRPSCLAKQAARDASVSASGAAVR